MSPMKTVTEDGEGEEDVAAEDSSGLLPPRRLTAAAPIRHCAALTLEEGRLGKRACRSSATRFWCCSASPKALAASGTFAVMLFLVVGTTNFVWFGMHRHTPVASASPDGRVAMTEAVAWHTSAATLSDATARLDIFQYVHTMASREKLKRAGGYLDEDTSFNGGGQPEVELGCQQWEVILSTGVKVRESKSFDSNVIGHRKAHDVLEGILHDGWVALSCESGYVKVKLDDPELQLLWPREESYVRLPPGITCGGRGLKEVPKDNQACAMAAQRLGFANTNMDASAAQRLESCHVVAGRTLLGGSTIWQAQDVNATAGGPAGRRKLLLNGPREAVCSTGLARCHPCQSPGGRQTDSLDVVSNSDRPHDSVGLEGAPRDGSSKDSQDAHSIFCFMVLEENSSGRSTLHMQLNQHTGVFGCDAWAVYDTASAEDVELSIGRRRPWDWQLLPRSDTESPLLLAWRALVKAVRIKLYDWVVQVQADTVFLPQRFSRHMFKLENGGRIRSRDEAVLLRACPSSHYIDSPLEVFSQMAVSATLRLMAESTPCPVEFDVHLTKEPLAPSKFSEVGLGTEAHGDSAIAVTRIDDGMVATWNAEHPDKAVKPGDRLVEVNGIRGDVPVMEGVLVDSVALTIVFSRGGSLSRSCLAGVGVKILDLASGRGVAIDDDNDNALSADAAENADHSCGASGLPDDNANCTDRRAVFFYPITSPASYAACQTGAQELRLGNTA